MYFIVLNIGAYTLLLSSFITIVTLLRKQFKQRISTPLYILSTSDVLFSMLTSSILLINSMDNSFYVDHNKWNIFSLNNSVWYQDDNGKNQKDKYDKIYDNFNSIINQNGSSVTPECNITSIIMKYGMLLIPFTNSFVSLLIFSVQCNLNVFSLKNQCYKFLQLQECVTEKTCENDNSENKSGAQNLETCERIEYEDIQFDSKFQLTKHANVSTTEQNKRKLLQIFKCNEMKMDNKKITSIFVIIQWIIPIFVTGILYLIEYEDKSYMKNRENTKCIIENNFFFNDCYSNIKHLDITQKYPEIHTVPLYKDYIDNEELVKTPNSNNTQANEIISKVQSIINSILNDTYNKSNVINHTNLYNTSDSFDIIKYMQFNTDTKIVKDNNSILDMKTNGTEDILMTEYENPYNLSNTENNTYLLNHVQLTNATNEYDKELLLFNYLIKNSSENILVTEKTVENEVITNITERLQFDKNNTDSIQTTKAQAIADELIEVTTLHNALVISNDQIYEEILKRIYNITTQHKLKNRYNNNSHQHNRKQSRYKKFEQDFQYNSTVNKQNVLSVFEITIYQNDNISQITLIYTMHKCLISIQFLKLHLLVLIFVIYFLPILFSSILQQHGKLNCRIVSDRLKAKSEMLSTNFNGNFASKINSTSINSFIDYREVPELKQDPMQLKESFEDSDKDSDVIEQIETYNNDSKNSRNDRYKIMEHDGNKMHLKMIKQMENILKLLDTIKMSLLCGILLWTPVFLEVLFKVFTLLFIPEWLLSITYLCAIAYGILRNIFNLEMIKLQEIDTSTTKTNSIHPIN